MKITDLTEDKKDLFCLCLEDWSDDAKEAGPKRRQWLGRSEKLGLRAKLAVDDNGVEGGMIQYGPIEHSNVGGEGLYFVYCIHVHGHKQGRGNFQGHGMGSALLSAAEEDARRLGAKGRAAWGVWLPFWMKASWFKKHGYRKADRQGIAMLLWKPFADDAKPPHWLPPMGKRPEPIPGKVNVTAFSSGWCLAPNLVYERAKRAAADLGDKVAFREIDTSTRDAVAEWGIADAPDQGCATRGPGDACGDHSQDDLRFLCPGAGRGGCAHHQPSLVPVSTLATTRRRLARRDSGALSLRLRAREDCFPVR